MGGVGICVFWLWNYRHQAEVCRAYQVLLSHGFDHTYIILFSYDDVPSDPLNPLPNTLYNRPGDAPNVNQGCVKDYTGVFPPTTF